MRFFGKVEHDRFAELYGLASQYNVFWIKIDDSQDPIEFELVIHDRQAEFEAELDKLFPGECKPKTLWKKIINFFK